MFSSKINNLSSRCGRVNWCSPDWGERYFRESVFFWSRTERGWGWGAMADHQPLHSAPDRIVASPELSGRCDATIVGFTFLRICSVLLFLPYCHPRVPVQRPAARYNSVDLQSFCVFALHTKHQNHWAPAVYSNEQATKNQESQRLRTLPLAPQGGHVSQAPRSLLN